MSMSMSMSICSSTSSVAAAAWLRFFTITGVIGVVSCNGSLDWDISCPGLVLSHIGDVFFISVGGLVCDDRDFSGLSGDDCPVLSVILGVEPGVALSSVLSLMLNSVVGVEDGVVAGLLIRPVLNLVLVGVSSLWLVSVLGL